MVPPLASVWMINMVALVVEVGAVFMSLGPIVPRVSTISANFACEGVNPNLGREH